MSALYGYPDYYLTTAHDTPVCELGSRFTAKEKTNYAGKCGQWDVVYVRATTSITRGTAVASYGVVSVADSGTSTVNAWVDAAGFPVTADLLVGGRIDVDVGATPIEADTRWIKSNTSGLIVPDVAFSDIPTNGDTATVSAPYLCMPGTIARNGSLLGVPLATATIGQYLFVLQRGFYPIAIVTTAVAIVGGCGMASNDSAAWIQYTVIANAQIHQVSGPKAYSMGTKTVTTSSGTTFPIFVTC